jgi:hypothetical protein
MQTKELFELAEAKRIVESWAQCVPGSDILQTSQDDRSKKALELEAQMLVDTSEHSEAIVKYFSEFGIDVVAKVMPKAKFTGIKEIPDGVAVLTLAITLIVCFTIIMCALAARVTLREKYKNDLDKHKQSIVQESNPAGKSK